jgi:hypothetical protein|tara:strand:+ start:6611 stop:7024 length:414 start_codon:yes stop_codon:yes gene_type:complete
MSNSKSNTRISRHEVNRVISGLTSRYGMVNQHYGGNNEFKEKVNDSIREFRKIALEEQRDWDRELRKVARLHKILNIALENLSHSFSGDILVIDKKAYIHICKCIDAFNVYLTHNQLFNLQYNRLPQLILPKEVVMR